ncbi:hypothetical protein [Vulgatibacter sp.]|uniref:hypothetical protein n=1 Tax=Vulgatibacter sp. TaxID=1971226 RepID=UPI0035667FC4
MKRFVVAALLATGILAVGGVAQAQDTVIQEADKVVYKKKTVVDFNDVTLEGELTKPEGTYGMARKRTSFSSLIQMRENFLPELQKSVDNL